MKVPDSLNKASGLGTAKPQTRAGKTQEKVDADKTSSDSVTLSSEAQALAGLEPESHVFDAKKVAEIRAALANPDSKFKINAERIADGVINMAKDLISAKG